MRRQRRTHYHNDDDYDAVSSINDPYSQLLNGRETDNVLFMDSYPRTQAQHRFENTIEAKVEVGDTLQALALRFHCTVADIKRLNKIDKDNEIHARKVIKIPVTVHSVLLCTLPEVHKSGNNSPKAPLQDDEMLNSNIMRNPLEDARVMLSEKLLVASVNSAGVVDETASSSNVNNTILNSSRAGKKAIYTDDVRRLTPNKHHTSTIDTNDLAAPLLSDILDDEVITQIRPIRGPALSAFDWSGSDCDMSWVCLFVVILGVCFLIPLIYVIHLAEHQHHLPHNTTIATTTLH